VRGDRVEIVVAADDGSRTYNITAARAGRRVEVTSARGIIEVAEVTRSGEPVRRARFMASRVLALVEHPAGESGRQHPRTAEPGRTAGSGGWRAPASHPAERAAQSSRSGSPKRPNTAPSRAGSTGCSG
jgi:hypothetical protein